MQNLYIVKYQLAVMGKYYILSVATSGTSIILRLFT